MDSIGTRMKTARLDQHMSREKATQTLARRRPELAITTKTLQRLEADEKVALTTVHYSALCEVYGTSLKVVAPEMVAEAQAWRDLLISNCPWIQETSLAS